MKKIGIIIFGIINFLILGIFQLFSSIIIYFYPEKILDKFNEILKEKSNLIQITTSQIKIFSIINAFIAILFLISGIGLIFKKDIARRFTIYFSFIFLILSFLSVLVNPALFNSVIIYFFYLIILILYLTSKNIQTYFK